MVSSNLGFNYPLKPRQETAAKILIEQERVWRKKPSLRAIYASYFQAVFSYCLPGKTLEVGAGFGGLKNCGYEVISTDVVSMPTVDVVSDAQSLPFASGSFENIVAIDVFHHLERPIRFLREARRVLGSNGRLVMLEPGITPVSHWFYRRFHSEPVVMGADVLADGPVDRRRDPFAANQAFATLLVTRFKEELQATVPRMNIRSYRWLGSLAYPLSGGFQDWCLVPQALTRPVLALESMIDSVLGRWLGFRILVILESDSCKSLKNSCENS